MAERLVNLVYSEETAAAVRRIEEMAATLGDNYGHAEDYGAAADVEMNYEFLLAAAGRWLGTWDEEWEGEHTTQLGSERWRDRFPGMAEDFWANYQRVTGRQIPDARKISFFSCSC